MGWIKERILAEKRKHEEYLDWAQIAEDKILIQLKEQTNIMNTIKCPICNKEFKNSVDPITKKISPYLWEPDCEHMKGIRLSRG